MQDVMRVLEPLHAYDLIHLVVDVRRRLNLENHNFSECSCKGLVVKFGGCHVPLCINRAWPVLLSELLRDYL